MFQSFSIPALSFFNLIIQPAFGDQAVSATGFNGTLSEFTLMNNVVSSRTIVNIRRVQNIMQRRDASCDIVYKNLFGATTRKITVTEIYGAVKFCKNEFYQGCLKEFRSADPVFGSKILPYFKSAINTDLTTNAYFGDVDRVVSPSAAFSTDLFDGIFKWLKVYTSSSVIPSAQTIQIASNVDYKASPVDAFNVIKGLYDRQPKLMKTFTPDQLAYYVSPEILEGYEDYLVATGNGNVDYINDVANGRVIPAYKKIRILAEPLWTPTITDIKGSEGYAAILTIRGNFVFGTDDKYGEDDGSGTDKALIIWYDMEHFTWKYMMFLKAGTAFALPEFTCYAISSFV